MTDQGAEVKVTVYAVKFIVPGDPVAWKRVGRDVRFGHSYLPNVVRRAERLVGLAYKAAGGKMIEGPVTVSCAFYLGGRCTEAHLDPRDVDNLEKTVLDGLEGVAYRNDRRVVGGSKVKRIDKARPRTEIIVAAASPMMM
jgi:crossover junction endodeoxyribonuclease RusA